MTLDVLVVGDASKETLEELSLELGPDVRLRGPYPIRGPSDWERLPEASSECDAVLLLDGLWDRWEVLREVRAPVIVWSWTREGVLNPWLMETLWWLRGHGVDVPVLYHLDDLRALSALKSLRGAKILALGSAGWASSGTTRRSGS